MKYVIMLACLLVGACGLPTDYDTKRGIGVFNKSGLCPPDVVQTWEDAAVKVWDAEPWTFKLENERVDAYLWCLESEALEVDTVVEGVWTRLSVPAYLDYPNIVLGRAGSSAPGFAHEFLHWAITRHPPYYYDPDVHHALFRGEGW